MCNDEKNPRLAPLTASHKDYLVGKFPHQKKFLEAAYDAVTQKLHPGFNVLVLLAVMYERLNQGTYGIMKDFSAVRFPLSLVGVDNVRYRTPVMKDLHETILSLNMASKNMHLLDVAMGKLGLKVLMTCSCGVVLIPLDSAEVFYISTLLEDMDNYRSVLDRFGYPVQYVEGIGNIPCLTVDATQEDKTIFQDVEELVSELYLNVKVHQEPYMDERKVEVSKSNLIQHVLKSGAILPQEYALPV